MKWLSILNHLSSHYPEQVAGNEAPTLFRITKNEKRWNENLDFLNLKLVSDLYFEQADIFIASPTRAWPTQGNCREKVISVVGLTIVFSLHLVFNPEPELLCFKQAKPEILSTLPPTLIWPNPKLEWDLSDYIFLNNSSEKTIWVNNQTMCGIYFNWKVN